MNLGTKKLKKNGTIINYIRLIDWLANVKSRVQTFKLVVEGWRCFGTVHIQIWLSLI